MNALVKYDDRLSMDDVRALVDRHGLWRVLRAAAAAALRRRVVSLHVDKLSDHLRRDIGLPVRGETPMGLMFPRDRRG